MKPISVAFLLFIGLMIVPPMPSRMGRAAWAAVLAHPVLTPLLAVVLAGFGIFMLFESWAARDPLHFAARLFFRVAWRVTKLISKVCIVGFVVFGLAVAAVALLKPRDEGPAGSGGPQGERWSAFLNSLTWIPQHIWYFFIGVLQVIAVIFLLCMDGLYEWSRLHLPLIGIASALAFSIWFYIALEQEFQAEASRLKPR